MKKIYKNNVETFHKLNPKNDFIIDKQTSKDLSLDDFYIKYNNTKTTYGDQYFYHKINSQCLNYDKTDMNRDLSYLNRNEEVKKGLSILLEKHGKQGRGNVVKDLWHGLKYTPSLFKFIPYWVLITPVLLTVSFILFGNIAFWGLMIYVLINLFIFRQTNSIISSTAGSMNYIIRTLSTLINIKKNKKYNYFNNSFNYEKRLNRIMKYKLFLQDGLGTSLIASDIGSSLLDYLRVFLCAEIFAYYKIYKLLNSLSGDVRNIIENLGYLDFIINSSDIMEKYKTSIPEIKKQNSISFKDMYHPLIDCCVPYEESISNSMIITGMNMAGKSTFMKSIAINQILSMSFGFTFAKAFKTSELLVISSMKVEDDIKNNKSKYYKEAERLLHIQNRLKEDNILCLIDEILTGTNTIDRIEASIGILNSFNKNKGSIILAATHDKDIAKSLYPDYSNNYFDGTLEDKKIVYDYKLKSGIVTSRNAFQLLQEIGLEV